MITPLLVDKYVNKYVRNIPKNIFIDKLHEMVFLGVVGTVPNLYLQQERNTRKCPLSGLVFALEVEGPDVGGPARPSFVHRTLVHVAGVLLVLGNGPYVDDGHGGEQFLEPGVRDDPRGHVPPRALHQQPVHVGAVPRRHAGH